MKPGEYPHYSEGTFVQHTKSGRRGFVLVDLDWDYLIFAVSGASDAVWGADRIKPSKRKPTDREWAKYVAYRMTL
jgi:hypothetical protein